MARTAEALEVAEARASLLRELERVSSSSSAQYLLQRLERLIDAKIALTRTATDYAK